MNILISISVLIVINKRSNLSVLKDGSSQIMGQVRSWVCQIMGLLIIQTVIVAQKLKYAQVCHENNF